MSDGFGAAADTAIEHAAADAAAGLAGKTGPVTDPNCLNCGALLAGEFCHDCGQSALSIRRPFWSLVGESLETFFSIDGRIARTLPDLMLRPGRMTRAYLDGKRARFIPAFRLYVLASLIFFVLMPLITGQVTVNFDGSPSMEEARAEVEKFFAEGEITEAEYQQALKVLEDVDAAWKGGIPGLVPEPPAAPGEPPPADAEPTAEEEWAGFVPQSAIDAAREAGEAGNEEAAEFADVMEDPARLARQTQEWIPRLMFVLLPVYALLLALTYLWRRQFLFFDHLIVSLHFHSALFFAMSVGFLVSLLIGAGWVMLALLIYSNWYLYRLHRVVYGRSGYSSVLRTITLDVVYLFVLLSGLLTAVILGALSL
ncbi:DUF3667 domain-containing protein [Hyphomonas sp.]|uniref:DUF3667 domain-containing protein n=1 Tax=Hyphomonas sp. TaxID=87 RepID=UPI000A4D40D0|nr:DUF3667 domain-containing protein [Hyphomonas sp.]